jgi:Flp pilus assembly protein TadG
LGLLAFIGFLALGIDLGQLYVVRNELQNVADGAALAAAKALVQDKNGDGNSEVYCDEAVNAAVACAGKNNSLGAATPIKITAADVTVGKWNVSTKTFDSVGCSANVDAVQVTVNRTGGDNAKVDTFLGGVIGAGSQQDSKASAVALLGKAGTSSMDLPVAVSPNYPAGGTPTVRMLDKLGPQPAYAALPQTYKFKDLGGSNLDTTRATFVVPTSGEVTLSDLQKYIKGPGSGARYPQVKVGQKMYPASEYKWGSNVKSLFTLLKTRYDAKKNAAGKWRVTLPVYSVTPVTAALPQDSWFKVASRLLPGVSQAYACQAYTTPAVYNQGFVAVDITDVQVPACNTSTDQVTDPNSCRNKAYAQLEPVNQNTVSTDKGSNPVPFQKDYKNMNPGASSVGVFAGTPRIVK